MASGKRASMREGPLAALFRRTDEDPDTTAVAAADAAAAGRDAAETAVPEAPSAPHPSLLAQSESARVEDEPAVPSPQERLRAAFSSDIPENIIVDISELMLNQGVRVRDLHTEGAKWKPVTDGDLMIVHVVALKVEEPAADAAALPVGTAEPEVIKKGKTDKDEEK